MTTISKADYLQKYMSGVDITNKSNRKKHRKIGKTVQGYKIIDDDVDVKDVIRLPQLPEPEKSDDDIPVVVAMHDDSNNKTKLDPRQWTVIGCTTSDEKQNFVNLKMQGKRRHDSSDNDSLKQGTASRTRQGKQQYDLGGRLVQRHSTHDHFPVKQHKHVQDSASDSDIDQSSKHHLQSEYKTDKLEPHNLKRLDNESEQSSPQSRKNNSSEIKQPLQEIKSKQVDSRSDQSPLRVVRIRHDSESDQSPPRSKKGHFETDKPGHSARRKWNDSGSDQSPSRVVKKRHDSESDQSPPRSSGNERGSNGSSRRKIHNSESRQSPSCSRKNYLRVDEAMQSLAKKPNKVGSSHAELHARKGSYESGSDQSPPRAVKKRRNLESDQSPPHAMRNDLRNSQTLSPSRRNRHDSQSDQSPPRETKKNKDSRNSLAQHQTKKEQKRGCDELRQQKSEHSSRSAEPPSRSARGEHDSESDQSLRSTRKESYSTDKYSISQSNTGKKHSYSNSSGKQFSSRNYKPQDENQDSTQRSRHSPFQKRSSPSSQDLTDKSHKSSSRTDSAHRGDRRNERSDNFSSLHFAKTSGHNLSKQRENMFGRPDKTLSGLKAGLQSSQILRTELKEAKVQENKQFKEIDDSVLGRGAQTVFRDRSTGKLRDVKEENRKEEMKKAKENQMKEKYREWGQGLKQQDDRRKQIEEEQHEMTKPLARYEGDEDLEKHLREQERVGDPMLQFLRKKKAEGTTKYPVYQGPPPPPNRFNIKPGYRWDGVDRSNGFEKKLFERQSSRVAREEEAYRWSTENM